eukprot:SM000044S15930  [mRNA]  locus=s44:3217:4717:- [translate_table: standard]
MAPAPQCPVPSEGPRHGADADARTLKFMRMALDESRAALARAEVPVGCVIVHHDEVIGRGSNRTNETRNATRHAEMEAFDDLLKQWRTSGASRQEDLAALLRDSELYAGLRKVYFGCANYRFGGCGAVLPLNIAGCGPCGKSAPVDSRDISLGTTAPALVCAGGILADEAIELFQSFYEHGNPNGIVIHT